MTPALPHPRRILIVRVSALGDIVFCTSLLEGLRLAFPDAHIAWLAQPAFAGIVEGDSRLNQILRLPAGALNSLSGLLAVRRLLRAQAPYDWVIDAQGLFKTRLLVWLAPARQRVGFHSKEPGGFLMHRLIEKGGEIADISSEYRFLARQLTGTDPGAPRLIPGEAARAKAQSLLREAGLSPGFIALCPFTTRPQKHWMEPYWSELALCLQAAGIGPCVLFGGPGDLAAAGRIMATMPAGTVDLVGRTGLPELPAVLEQAGLVIGVDTGLTHIGIAVRRPVLALFGSTCPYTRGAESALRVMYDGLSCSPCKRHPTCNGAFTCLRDITPQRVAVAAQQLLRGGQ